MVEVIRRLEVEAIVSRDSARLANQYLSTNQLKTHEELFNFLVKQSFEELPRDVRNFFDTETTYYAIPLPNKHIAVPEKYKEVLRFLQGQNIISETSEFLIAARLNESYEMDSYCYRNVLNHKFLEWVKSLVDK